MANPRVVLGCGEAFKIPDWALIVNKTATISKNQIGDRFKMDGHVNVRGLFAYILQTEGQILFNLIPDDWKTNIFCQEHNGLHGSSLSVEERKRKYI